MNQPEQALPEEARRDALSVPAAAPKKYNRVQRLAALLDELDVGLVSVDPAGDYAAVNETAAALLNLSPGNTTADEFTSFLENLAATAVNRDEAEGLLALLRHDARAEIRTTWAFPEAPTHLGVVSKPAPYPGFDGRIWAFYDNSALAQAIAAADDAGALIRASSDAILDPIMVLEAQWENGRVADLVYRDVNAACAAAYGLTREEMLGRRLFDNALRDRYAHCAETGEPAVLDAFPHRSEVSGTTRYYDVRATQVRHGLVAVTWRDVTARIEAENRLADSGQQFRLLAENVADVVARISPDGRVAWISNNVEAALGASAEYYTGRHVTDFVPPDRRETYAAAIADTVGGETFIGRFRIVAADGSPHWVHQHAKPFHEADGSPNGIVVSFRIIDDEVAAEEAAQAQIAERDAQNRSLTRRLQSQTDRLLAELKNAARYFSSILPGDLDGPVRVTSRYVPSLHLSGDSYDYRWVDDDHLLFYLVDVSGHGVESAMLSASVHNVLRSGSLSPQKLLQPAAVLAELNRLFQMDDQDDHYFTIWYGVYQRSTRRLRYACGGHPPALVLSSAPDGEVSATPLAAAGLPIGTFEETQFAAETVVVQPGSQILLYSDGAFELDLEAGQWQPKDFTDLCVRVARSPDWSIDDLLAELALKTESGLFEDDCTVVRLTFD